MNYKGLVEKKNDLITRAEAILSDAEQAKRELTDDEAQELAGARHVAALADLHEVLGVAAVGTVARAYLVLEQWLEAREAE